MHLGDWFLDQIGLMPSLKSELVSLIPENQNSDPKISLAMKCLKAADLIHKGLQDMALERLIARKEFEKYSDQSCKCEPLNFTIPGYSIGIYFYYDLGIFF